MSWKIPVFGVRHLSPSGAWHLRRFLDAHQPDVVLIEGPSDASYLIPDMTRKATKPPIAFLAYTDTLPIRTFVYPLARYSPEYQAMLWAKENKKTVRFIDLPSGPFLGLQDIEHELLEKKIREHAEQAEKESAENAQEAKDPLDSSSEATENDQLSASEAPKPKAPVRTPSIYEQFAIKSGEPDYETYWERHFEHNLSDQSYQLAAHEFGAALRELEPDSPRWRAENLVREAYMRRQIADQLAQKTKPERIVAVVGAFHAPVISGEFPAMTDEEFASLRTRSCKLTLMPYSYYKLSSQSGYGAGNHAPAYFELLWDMLERGETSQLSSKYLTLVARHLRTAGTHRSTAEVIEGVRLANVLSAFKGGIAPTLRDLRDAAVTLMGHGELSVVSDALVRVDVGTDVGELPEGVSQTSIQADFDRELKRLLLQKYKTTVKQELALDLRENRRVASEEAAYLDLNRSSFLNRLHVLEIGFAEPIAVNQQTASWSEKWHLRWSPENEIALVEAVLLGETVELATAYKFKTNLEKCTSIAEAATMIRSACNCGLMESLELARQTLQELTAVSHDFQAIAHAAYQLSLVVQFGDVRRYNPAPLLPLIHDLFVQGSLALFDAANCDQQSAKEMFVAIEELNKVSHKHHDIVDESLWTDHLQKLADADDRNALLSGYACSILLERGIITNDSLAREVSRRLSPGISADLGAGWFEGLSQRNRYALLARQPLWEQLADYLASLDEEQFKRALVFLRRAFGTFSPTEKRHIAENLGHYWGVGADEASELLNQPMSQEEEQALDDLKDFDFGDL